MSPQGNAEVYEDGAEGNGRDRAGLTWRDRSSACPENANVCSGRQTHRGNSQSLVASLQMIGV